MTKIRKYIFLIALSFFFFNGSVSATTRNVNMSKYDSLISQLNSNYLSTQYATVSKVTYYAWLNEQVDYLEDNNYTYLIILQDYTQINFFIIDTSKTTSLELYIDNYYGYFRSPNNSLYGWFCSVSTPSTAETFENLCSTKLSSDSSDLSSNGNYKATQLQNGSTTPIYDFNFDFTVYSGTYDIDIVTKDYGTINTNDITSESYDYLKLKSYMDGTLEMSAYKKSLKEKYSDFSSYTPTFFELVGKIIGIVVVIVIVLKSIVYAFKLFKRS